MSGRVDGRVNVTVTPLPFGEAILLLWGGGVRTVQVKAAHIMCSRRSET